MKRKRKTFSISLRYISVAIAILIVLGIGVPMVVMTNGQTSPTSPPSFSYASNYPIFTVTTGSGLLPTSNWNVFGAGAHGDNNWEDWIYQPMAYADFMTGQLYPMLARNWTFADNNHEMIVNLRRGIVFYYNGTWSNGSNVVITWPFTSKDVLATFKDYFAVYGNPYNMTVTANGPYQVTFYSATVNIPYDYYTILTTYILPWEQYGNLTNPTTAVISVPVGTGPYYLYKATPTQAYFLRNPDFWIPGRPFIPEMSFIPATSNAYSYGLLAKGQAQWGGTGSTGSTPFSKLFTYANPTYYGGMASIGNGSGGQPSFLWINYEKLGYWPWNESWFRYALSIALNRTAISVGSQFGITTGAPPTSATFLPSPMEQEWINSSVIQEASTVDQYNVSGALSILESHGLKIVNGQLTFPNGTPLPAVTMINYEGFSDTFATSVLIANELKQNLGLQVSVISVPPSEMFTDEDAGQYDLIYWLTNGYSPYFVYDSAFIPPLEQLPNGTFVTNVTALNGTIYTDPGRWIPPQQFINLWIQAGETTNVTQLKQIYSTMAAILTKDLPAIPVVFDAYPRYEYETQYYVGFSTPLYFYTWNVEPWIEGNELMLLNIAPRPPDMTQSQMVTYTQTAWQDLQAYLYGKANTATPQSLISMLQPSNVTTTNKTTTTTTTNTTSSPPTTPPPPTSHGLSTAEIAAIVVVVVVIVAVVAVVVLRRR